MYHYRCRVEVMNVEELKNNCIYNGNSWELVKQLTEDSVDCIVTSPPYLLGFARLWC